MSAYERVRVVVDELDRRFYALLDACDDYDDLLTQLGAEEQTGETANAELVRRYAHQRREIGSLREELETSAMEVFLRIIDRVKMIEATEQGRFL